MINKYTKYFLIFFVLSGRNIYSKNTITVSTGYFESYYTNKYIANFGIEYLNLSNLFIDKAIDKLFEYDKLYEQKSNLRHIANFTSFLIKFYIIEGFTTAYHELGHAMRNSAVGYDYYFGISDVNMYHDMLVHNKNFFSFLFDTTFVRPLKGGYTMPIINSTEREAKTDLIISAAGINNETYFQEKVIERNYLNNNLNISNFLYFISSKIGNIRYVISSKKYENNLSYDPNSVLINYRLLNINVDRDDLIKSFAISILSSQFTYSFLYSIFSGEYYKQHRVEPLKYKSFFLPDIFPYMTSKGISYRIKSGYKYSDNLSFRFGIEFITIGNYTQEFIFGINKKFENNQILDFTTIFGKYGVNFELTHTIPVSKYINFNLDFDIYSTKSLHGERNARNLYRPIGLINNNADKIDKDYDFSFALSLTYLF